MKFAWFAAEAAVLAGAFVALPLASAVAAPGVVGTNVNLRQGPTTSSPILAKIPAGSAIDVAGCSGEWCQVGFAGRSGYIIATALGQAGPPGAPPPGAVPPPGYEPPPVYAGPPVYYGYGPYYGGYYGGGCCWRGGWRGGGGWGRRW
jgi:hypothetical protein